MSARPPVAPFGHPTVAAPYMTASFPEILDAALARPRGDTRLDGELVV